MKSAVWSGLVIFGAVEVYVVYAAGYLKPALGVLAIVAGVLLIRDQVLEQRERHRRLPVDRSFQRRLYEMNRSRGDQ